MAGHQTADIVFCMDASGSMSPTFDGVRDNVIKLVNSLKADLQNEWDVRFDFLAYSNHSCSTMRLETMNCKGKTVLDELYGNSGPNGCTGSGNFFTSDVREFIDKIKNVECNGDEASGLALDIASDFPFRDAATCHRVVILLTDESISTGEYERQTEKKVMDLAKKFQDKKIALYMVTPDCTVYDTLSQIDKCEWTIDSSDGLTNVDFTKLMQSIGKSVSVSQSTVSGRNEPQPLFNESKWSHYNSDQVIVHL